MKKFLIAIMIISALVSCFVISSSAAEPEQTEENTEEQLPYEEPEAEINNNLWGYTYDFYNNILGESTSPMKDLFLDLTTLLTCTFIIFLPFLLVFFMIKTLFRSIWE